MYFTTSCHSVKLLQCTYFMRNKIKLCICKITKYLVFLQKVVRKCLSSLHFLLPRGSHKNTHTKSRKVQVSSGQTCSRNLYILVNPPTSVKVIGLMTSEDPALPLNSNDLLACKRVFFLLEMSV